MSTAPLSDDRDFPRMPAERGWVEPSPRRVRGYLGHELIFDTTAARYVWEAPYYPQYYVPHRDVRPGCLVDDDRPQRVEFGHSRLHSVTGSGVTHPSAARVFADDDGPVAGLVRFDVDGIRWFEEDEPIYGHPRNPYARVDALRSHRRVTVALGDVVLADTMSPVMLFETGLPTRYYIDPTDVAFDRLIPSGTQTLCPYKGATSGYWSVQIADELHRDLAWSYHHPLPAVAAIAGMVAFYNEKVDVAIDGFPTARPHTHFS